MPVKTLCSNPDCLASYTVADEAVGRSARCKKCGTTFRLEASQADAPIDLPEPDEPDDGDEAPTLKPGSAFAHYTIGRLLGRGGMGAVYLATDSKLRRQVALKIPDLPPGSAGTAAGRRFLREARAAAALSHPNICPVYEVGETDGRPYLTMELVEGQGLDGLLKREGALPADRAVAIVRALALALAKAHAKGIVHRDLKPSNVLMCPDRGPVLTDFGLAKFLEGQSVALTRTGGLLGTPAYMSPEQVNAEPIGPASDVFSLGVILYELLTGRRPFDGGTFTALMMQIATVKPKRPSTLVPGLDLRLDEVCGRALAKKPDERYASMAEFAAALEGLGGLSSSAVPSVVAAESPSTQVPIVAEPLAPRPAQSPSPAPLPRESGGGGPDVPTSGSRSDGRGSAPPAGRVADRGGPPAAAPPGRRNVRATPGPRHGTAGSPPRRWPAIALGVGLPMLVVALGIVVYWKTDIGTVKVTVNRPDAVAYVDGQELRVEGEGLELRLRAGTHRLMVMSGNVAAEAPRTFEVRRGAETVVAVEFPAEPPASAVAAAPEVEKEAAPTPDPQPPAPKPADVPPPRPAAPPKSLTNTVGMKLLRIEPGSFLMGSPDSDDMAEADEKPQHRVEVTKPFYLGATEVTVGQFRRFVEAEGYKTDAEKDGKGGYGWNESKGSFEKDPKYSWRNAGFTQGDDHPVVNVSWNDAVAFCAWLSKKEGESYRLPTEAEWEYACRAGTTTRYQTGDDPEGLARVGNVADATLKAKIPSITAIDASDGALYTAAVGRYRENRWGLYDLHGNVWEWCSDGYDSGYYAQSPAADPAGPPQAPARVIRGGGWSLEPRDARSALRDWGAPESRFNFLGFRVARGRSG